MIYISTTTAILFLGLSLFSCEKRAVLPIPPISASFNNSIIQEGKIEFRNTKVTLSKGTLFITGKCIQGSGSGCNGSTIELTLSFIAKGNGIYPLAATTSSWGFCSMVSPYYVTDTIHTGTIAITDLDTVRHLVSGTFNFSAEMEMPINQGGTEKVTNGVLNNLTW